MNKNYTTKETDFIDGLAIKEREDEYYRVKSIQNQTKNIKISLYWTLYILFLSITLIAVVLVIISLVYNEPFRESILVLIQENIVSVIIGIVAGFGFKDFITSGE
jgi:hypothetical protein